MSHTPRFRTGLVLGKFMPPHAGHMHMLRFAAAQCETLVVAVDTVAGEPIPAPTRAMWLRDILPRHVRVVVLDGHRPQEPHHHPDFWAIWRRALTAACPEALDAVFASEAYGHRLATELGARFVMVDQARTAVPISGTAVRADPFSAWAYLPAPVRAHYTRRVRVVGPESTGKSTLSARLAAHYGTTWVPEYARAFLEAFPRSQTGFDADDLRAIAAGQAASEDALAQDSNGVLVCDTCPLSTAQWAAWLCPDAPALHTELHAAAAARPYALTLLLDVDVPHVHDDVRYMPDGRTTQFDAFAALYASASPVVLRGDFDARFAQACAAIDAL